MKAEQRSIVHTSVCQSTFNEKSLYRTMNRNRQRKRLVELIRWVRSGWTNHAFITICQSSRRMNRSQCTLIVSFVLHKKKEKKKENIIGLFCSFINERRFPFMHRTETIVDIMTKVIDKRCVRLTESIWKQKQ